MRQKLLMTQILLLLSVCCLPLSAQRTVNRHRSVVQSKHLQFEGMDINGTSKIFFNKLKKRGYKIGQKEDHMQYFTYAIGSFAGENGWEINAEVGEENDSIYCIMLYLPILRYSEQYEIYNNVKKYIEEKYKYTLKECYINDDAYMKSEDSEVVYSIGDFGVISVACGNDGYQSYVGLRFTDKMNSRLYGIYFDKKNFEISNVSSQYKCCIIQTSEFEGVFSVFSNENIYKFVVRQDDAQQIYYLLNSKYDNTMKIYLLNNYILRQLNKCKNNKKMMPIITGDFKSMSQSYLAKVQEKKRKEAELKANPKMLLLEILRCTIFSREDRDALDSVIPPEAQRQMMGGMLRVVTADTSTQWDMLNGAQKAVIHESHNGR